MSEPKYAGIMPPRNGEPWEDWEDANILEDQAQGCTLMTIALRAQRDEDEVEKRLAQLGGRRGRPR